MDFNETDEGALLRSMADAVDTAEAFRAWDAPTMVVGIPGRVDPDTLDITFAGMINETFGECLDSLRTIVQGKLDARVEDLRAQIAVNAEPVPSQAPVAENAAPKTASKAAPKGGAKGRR